MTIDPRNLTEREIELLALAPNDDPGPKYKSNDVMAACPICNAVFWQREYLVYGKPSPETCGLAHGQILRAQRRAAEEGKVLLGQPWTAEEGVLTPRETEILTLRASGLTNSQIAERLGLTPGTVKNAVRFALRKVA